MPPLDFADLYRRFSSPITGLDCGERCAPHNERGVPFCCDTNHAVPTAYTAEWEYLQANTDLWRVWQGRTPRETALLQKQTPSGQKLIECRGHPYCQRDFRSITCRAFPFFPYIDRQGNFIGLSYYWAYEDRCWVISNLNQVSRTYLDEFVSFYEGLFSTSTDELENFRYHSMIMRRVFGRWQRSIPLLHRNGNLYKVAPSNGRMRRVAAGKHPRFGPYRIAARLPFSDES